MVNAPLPSNIPPRDGLGCLRQQPSDLALAHGDDPIRLRMVDLPRTLWLWGLSAGVSLLWMTMVAVVSLALAKDVNGKWAQVTPKMKEWFQKQRNPTTKVSCCNEADGDQVDEEIREGRYWIASDKTGGHWMIVPHDVIINEPNLYGRPVAWFRGGYDTAPLSIYCYAPGPLL